MPTHTFTTAEPSSQTYTGYTVHTLTGALGQVAEEAPEAGGEPLHALLQVSESLQITDVPQNLILWNQLITQIPCQHLRLLGKCRPVRNRKRNNENIQPLKKKPRLCLIMLPCCLLNVAMASIQIDLNNSSAQLRTVCGGR